MSQFKSSQNSNKYNVTLQKHNNIYNFNNNNHSLRNVGRRSFNNIYIVSVIWNILNYQLKSKVAGGIENRVRSSQLCDTRDNCLQQNSFNSPKYLKLNIFHVLKLGLLTGWHVTCAARCEHGVPYVCCDICDTACVTCVAECEHGVPSCPFCSGRSSETDVVNNCPKQPCNSTLVRTVPTRAGLPICRDLYHLAF